MYKVFSCFLYITVFSISLFCTNRAEKRLNKKKKHGFVLYSVIAVSILCLAASLRDIEVGSDTIRYYEYYETALGYSSFKNYYSRFQIQGVEIGYLFFCFVLSRLHLPVEFMSFILEALIVVPVFFYALKKRNIRPAWTYMAVFIFVFYNVSYNATRQLVALSFLLLAYYSLIEKGKLIPCILYSALALSFHRSAFIGIVFIIIGVIYKNIKISVLRQIGLLCGFIVLALSPFYFDRIFDLLYSLGMISNRNSFYMEVFTGTTGNSMFEGLGINGYASILFRVLFLILPFIFLYKSKEMLSDDAKAVTVIVIIGVVFYASAALAFNTIHIYRITMYSEIFWIPYFARLYTANSKKGGMYKVNIRNIIFVFFLFAYWYLTFIVFNYHQTSNYFMI
ncbi:MAG: EpsG family protein [Blautia sp.]